MVRYSGSPAIAKATSRPPAPKASMPKAPAAGVWLSEPARLLPGMPKRSICTGWLTPFPAPAVPDAEAAASGEQEKMIVGILIIGLQQIMIDVLHRQLGLDPFHPHGFQLQHHQGSRGVLGQGLIDAERDFGARLQTGFREKSAFHRDALPGDQMVPDQLLGQIQCRGHATPSWIPGLEALQNPRSTSEGRL